MFADVYIEYPLASAFTYRIPDGMELKAGVRVKVPFGLGNKKLTGFTAAVHNSPPEGLELKEIISVIDDEPLFDGRLIDLCRFAADSYCSYTGEALAMALPSGVKPSPIKEPVEFREAAAVKLSEEQQSVLEGISSGVAGGSLIHCIFGITGSGKTEVYIETAKRTIAANKSVIYLVPEISLSSQIYRRLSAVFGDRLVIYHSGLTAGQRLFNWKRFYKGDALIAVGTRSAVFLQAPELGLIIIDEEQDASFKEHSSPRYNAKRIALYRSKKEGTAVLLGSATPAVETLYAGEQGVLEVHRLTSRYGEASLPSIEIVSFAKERTSISSVLKLHTKRAVESGGQAIYLLNRRGFAPLVICDDCGEAIKCPHCTISINYHRGGRLVCHYCGYQRHMPSRCDKCGSASLEKVGTGTQKLEEEMAASFPNFRVSRLDLDSSRKKGGILEIIDGMNSGDIDILVGTQMVAKGFDFPEVSVVGILSADLGLNLPDFRAGERIFSLMVQAAGRAGRGKRQGHVFVQTRDPEHPIFGFIKTQDYLSFYRQELEARKVLNYPPFSRLLRLLVRGRNEEAVVKTADSMLPILKRLTAGFDDSVGILGPAAAPIEKIGDNYRRHFILKGRDVGKLRQIAGGVREELGQLPASLYLEIDVDPVELL